MDGLRALRFGASVALAATLLGAVVTPLPPPVAAMQDQVTAGNRLETRVTGTGSEGLTVRAGPGQSYTRLTVLPEGSHVHVVSGPRFDTNGRDWYLVTGYGRSGEVGWTAGEFLDRRTEARGSDVVAQSVGPNQRTLLATVTAY